MLRKNKPESFVVLLHLQQLINLKEFVLTGQIDKEQSKFYSNLYANRQSGDYDDFIMMNEDKVRELYPKAVVFIDIIERLINEDL